MPESEHARVPLPLLVRMLPLHLLIAPGSTFRYHRMGGESFTHTGHLEVPHQECVLKVSPPTLSFLCLDNVRGVVSRVSFYGLWEEGSLAGDCRGLLRLLLGRLLFLLMTCPDDIQVNLTGGFVSGPSIPFLVLDRWLPYSSSFSEFCVFQPFSRLTYLLCVPCIST